MGGKSEFFASDQSQESQSSGTQPSQETDALDDVILEFGEFTKIGSGFGKQQSATAPDEFAPTDDDLEDTGDEYSEKEVGDKKPKAKEDPKDDDDGDEKKDEESTVKHLRNVIRGMEKKISKMEKKISQPEPEEKPEEKLSEEQLLQIMKEHEGDPEVLLNVMKYLQKQGVKDSEKNAAEAAKIGGISKQADAYLSSVFDGYGSEEFFSEIDDTFPLEDWGLKGHPLARQIQAGLALAGAFKHVLSREVQKAQAKHGKIEEKRKEAIVQRGGLPKPKENAPVANKVLDENAARIAKEIGLSPSQQKLYASFVKKGK